MERTGHETAVLGGGCFWCLDAVFRELEGVVSVESGYAGGANARPTYEAVCGGRTGHAEVVRVTFDPAVLSFRDLLGVFFAIHDPTTKNRQGHDVGTQYRSAIFAQSPEQRRAAEALVRELERSEAVERAHRHRDRRRRDVLAGRGLPPGLLREQPGAALLHGRRRAQGREVPQGAFRPAEAAHDGRLTGESASSPGVAGNALAERAAPRGRARRSARAALGPPRDDPAGREARADAPEHRHEAERGAERAERERHRDRHRLDQRHAGGRRPRPCARAARATRAATSPSAGRAPRPSPSANESIASVHGARSANGKARYAAAEMNSAPASTCVSRRRPGDPRHRDADDEGREPEARRTRCRSGSPTGPSSRAEDRHEHRVQVPAEREQRVDREQAPQRTVAQQVEHPARARAAPRARPARAAGSRRRQQTASGTSGTSASSA